MHTHPYDFNWEDDSDKVYRYIMSDPFSFEIESCGMSPKKKKVQKTKTYKAYYNYKGADFSVKEKFPLDQARKFIDSYFARMYRELGIKLVKVVKIRKKVHNG